MKKLFSLFISTFFLILAINRIYAQTPVEDETESDYYKPSINIFTVYPSENGSALISLSDIYPLSEETASLVIPNMTERGFEEAEYTLGSVYRERFFSQTGTLETDSVFIYDYHHNNLATFAIKDLNVIARLTHYADISEKPFSQYYYMIGFEIEQQSLNEFEDNLWDALVYVGQENPFAQEQLTPLEWHQITAQEFPATSKVQDEILFSNYPWSIDFSFEGGNTYSSETNGFQYFIQDYMRGSETRARRLLVIEAQTQKIIIDKLFYESESTSLSSLNSMEGYDTFFQWTGKLFENKPPVVFGFLWVTFGCPYISVIDQSNEDIIIYCDNRH